METENVLGAGQSRILKSRLLNHFGGSSPPTLHEGLRSSVGEDFLLT